MQNLRRITEFFSSVYGNSNADYKHLVYKKIYDNIFLILQKNKALEYTQVETLYLLIALGELGRDYWLDFDALIEYVNIKKNEKSELFVTSDLNYLTIVVLLFYIKEQKKIQTDKRFC